MSIKLMSQVWDNSRAVKSDRLVVLLAMADYANEDGICWPKIKTVAAKARVSEEGASDILKALVKEGFLSIVERGVGRGKSNHYKVHPNGNGKPVERQITPDEKPRLQNPPSTNPPSIKGVSSPTPHIRNAHVEPSVFKPSVNSSVEECADATAPTSPPPSSKPSKKSTKAAYSHGSLIPLSHPFHAALMKICNVKQSSTDAKKQAVEEAARDLFADGHTPEQCEQFLANWWKHKFGQAYFGKAPTAKDLRDHFEEVLNLSANAATGKQTAKRYTAAELDAMAAKYATTGEHR